MSRRPWKDLMISDRMFPLSEKHLALILFLASKKQGENWNCSSRGERVQQKWTQNLYAHVNMPHKREFLNCEKLSRKRSLTHYHKRFGLISLMSE